MRGLAALAVALFHFNISLMPHGYLAVDFFFALSGFVLWRSYQPRWREGLGTRAFLARRLIRLYPLYALGLLLGAGYEVWRVVSGSRTGLDLETIALSLPFNALFMPSPFTIPLFPMNVPAWSLFFEVVANIALILVLFRLPLWLIAAIAIACGAGLAPIVLARDAANVGAIWGETGIGLLRTGFSFGLGLVLGGLSQRSHRPRGAVGMLCLGAIVFALYGIGFEPRGWYDLFVILLISPLLLFVGTRFEPSRLFAPLAAFAGDVSYALYAVHWPFIEPYRALGRHIGLDGVPMAAIFLGSMLALAWLVARFFDEPLRTLATSALRTRAATARSLARA
ncbi:hypothetical protein B2G71_15320 [Novosphingobium sp. PC22D]|nr:hypothetical protein B2G71_15320 [Novosphingobium sp. PC22D]